MPSIGDYTLRERGSGSASFGFASFNMTVVSATAYSLLILFSEVLVSAFFNRLNNNGYLKTIRINSFMSTYNGC